MVSDLKRLIHANCEDIGGLTLYCFPSLVTDNFLDKSAFKHVTYSSLRHVQGAAGLLSVELTESVVRVMAGSRSIHLTLGHSAAEFPLWWFCAHMPLGGNGSHRWELITGIILKGKNNEKEQSDYYGMDCWIRGRIVFWADGNCH